MADITFTPRVKTATGFDTLVLSGASTPTGIITLWYGSIASIPVGWALCDGQNGTPDMRGRFPVGAGGTYAVGNTGGLDSVTLSTAQMPSHGHTVQAHPMASGGTTWLTTTSFSGTPTLASYATSSVGSGSSHENRPPYYALAYIMKL